MTSIESVAKTVLTTRRRAIQRLFRGNAEEDKHLHEEREADWPDRAVMEETLVVLARLSDGERRELSEIDAALERIDRGLYGRCEQCHSSIGRQRLRAIPEARYCIACTERHEVV
jgi:DnaK suppressor protein